MIPSFEKVSPIKFSELNIKQKALRAFNINSDLAISGISEKSHLVKENFIFFALSGVNTHGAYFAGEAISRGAVIIVSDDHGQKIIQKQGLKVPTYVFQEPRAILAIMAASFFKNHPLNIIGVTGTNGKTSVAYYSKQLWEFLGEEAASIGTIGTDGLINLPLEQTTPDPIKLHWLLSLMAEKEIKHVVIEASSHGLIQHRLDGVKFSIGAFTNLSRDHFDYHKNIKSYFKAKSILFERLIPSNGSAVICTDDKHGLNMFNLAKLNLSKVIAVGKNKFSDIRILSQKFLETGQILKFSWEQKEHVIFLPLFGDFQAQNILLALGIINLSGANYEELLSSLDKLRSVPGRMQEVAIKKNGARVFVDYAHTPDALEAALRSIRLHFMGQIHLIFGAGGDRDKGKRILMGRVASSLSDNVIITDDNPRHEDPFKIRSQIKEGCPNAIEVGDRAEAIITGIDKLQNGDALLIAGKGHENTQTIGDSNFPFNDAEQASLAIQALEVKS